MTSVADAYDGAAAAWRLGPEGVYARMASALLAHEAGPLVGAGVLDIGAGTAVAGRVALDAGAAPVVAADLAIGMLRHRGPRIAAVCADAHRLPFADGSFDLAVAAFCLGHLPDPARALTEARRVAGRIAVSAFAPGWTHPAKAAVDEVMVRRGFVIPAWYRQVKDVDEPAVNDPDALASLARTAGFTDVRVRTVEVDSGLRTAADVVGWRFGMAHLAPFLATLPADELASARAEAEAVVAGCATVVIPILVLSGS
jgi:ubiquinone/menaquinone biosynthesis C-methylase UbiE